MNFNTTNFKRWQKSSLAPGELATYEAYEMEGKNRIAIFDNAEHLIEHFDTNFKNGSWKLSDVVTEEDKVNDWNFGKDFNTLRKTKEALYSGATAALYMGLIDKTREELYDKYPELRRLEQVAVTKRRRRRFSEDGEELDIDRYMTGDPAMFCSMPRQDAVAKTASFYIDIQIAVGTDCKNISQGVISALALVDIVERAGISTEVIIGATANQPVTDANLVNVSCIAKRANEPLDIARLLSFCLPGMYRNFIFSGWGCAMTNERALSGLGNGDWSFGINSEYFDFFNALVLFRVKDRFWTNGEMQLMINKVMNFFNVSPELTT
jgi:hypothetical protein